MGLGEWIRGLVTDFGKNSGQNTGAEAAKHTAEGMQGAAKEVRVGMTQLSDAIARVIPASSQDLREATLGVAAHGERAVESVASHLEGAAGTVAGELSQAVTRSAAHLEGAVGTTAVELRRAATGTAAHLEGAVGTVAVELGQAVTRSAAHLEGAVGTTAVELRRAATGTAAHLEGAVGTVAAELGQAVTGSAAHLEGAVGSASEAVALSVAATAASAEGAVGIMSAALAESTAQIGEGVSKVATEMKETVAVTAYHLERVADRTTHHFSTTAVRSVETIGDVTVKCVSIIAVALCFMVTVIFTGGPQPAYQLFTSMALQAGSSAAALASCLYSAAQGAVVVGAVGGTSYFALPPMVQTQRASREAKKLQENVALLQRLLKVKQEHFMSRATDSLKTAECAFGTARSMMVDGCQCSGVIADCQEIFMTPGSITLEQEIKNLVETCSRQKGALQQLPSLKESQWALLTQVDGLVQEARSPTIGKKDSEEILVLTGAAFEQAREVQVVVETLHQAKQRLEDRQQQADLVSKRLEERLAQLEQARPPLETAITALQARSERCEGRLTPLETASSALEERLSPLATACTDLKAWLTTLETTCANLKGRLTPLENARTALEGRITPLETGRTTQEGRLTTLETARTKLEGQLMPLEAACLNLQAWGSFLQSRITRFETTFRCRLGHVLVPAKIPREGFSCYGCEAELAQEEKVLACRLRCCQYDLCWRCVERSCHKKGVLRVQGSSLFDALLHYHYPF